MPTLKFLTFPEQLAEYLRDQILRGRWRDKMPGAPSLSAEFGVDHRTMIAAFTILEKDGILASQGDGRNRKIMISEKSPAPRLRLQLLLYGKYDLQQYYVVDLIHRLQEMGHDVSTGTKTLQDMDMNTSRVIRYVQKSDADAWIVFAASKEILQWFSQQPTPFLAFAGRFRQFPIAAVCPDKIPALKKLLRRLVELGHRRICMLSGEQRLKPTPGAFERFYLNELASHGIQTGPYNLPEWKDNIHDFHRCLDSLFKHTPPTALLITEMHHFIAAQQHLAQIGIIAPRDISLVCLDPDHSFDWCKPTVAHISWDPAPCIRRMTRWADHVARGKEDRRQSLTKAVFVEGGTIGPVPDKQKIA